MICYVRIMLMFELESFSEWRHGLVFPFRPLQPLGGTCSMRLFPTVSSEAVKQLTTAYSFSQIVVEKTKVVV
jgi:hypothetical protein